MVTEFSSNIQITLPALRLYHAINKTKPTKPALGVCLEGDTTLRLNQAVKLYELGTIDHIIVSGGVEKDTSQDQLPANSMKKYLISKELPEKAITLETNAKSTHEHPGFVNPLVKKTGHSDLIVITSGYHLLRAYLRFLNSVIAQGYPYTLYGVSSDTLHSWFGKTKTGNRRRIRLLNDELTKIRTYTGLASFEEAQGYIYTIKTRNLSEESPK